MAITNYDGIINSRGAGKGEDQYFNKTGTIGGVTANWYCFIKNAGSPTSATTYANASVAGSLMTSTMGGAIALSPTTGDDKYLLTFGGMCVGGAELTVLGLIDVLWAGAGIQLNSSATVTVGSATTLRSTNWRANQLGVMVSTAVGATASTMTVWYTDAGDTATSISVVLSSAGSQGRMLPAGSLGVPLPNGIKQINSAQVQTAQGSGAVDLFIFKPIAFIPTIALNTWVERDMTAQIDGLYKIDKDGSNSPGFLTVVAFTNGTTARAAQAFVRTCAG